VNKYKVSVPHRHTVVYEDNESKIKFEAEILTDGVVLYPNTITVIYGTCKNVDEKVKRVEIWLRNKFSRAYVE